MVAYFSMEIAVIPEFPTYSGGLGVLAGDTLRAAADMGLPLAAVTLAHRKGYFRQHLDAYRVQTEEPQPWIRRPSWPRKTRSSRSPLRRRPVAVRAWRYDMEGVSGHRIPIYFLDTESGAKRPEGPQPDRSPLRRRRGLSAAPGGDPGHWRGAPAAALEYEPTFIT